MKFMGHSMLFLKQKILNQNEKEYSEEIAQVWREEHVAGTEQQNLTPEDLDVTCSLSLHYVTSGKSQSTLFMLICTMTTKATLFSL